MADYAYAYNGPTEGIAKAMIKDSPISTKAAIEISSTLRGRTTKAAKALLERVIKEQEAIPFKRFTNGLGHKKGNIAAGRYPKKAAGAFLDLIKSAEANANQAGLSEDLIIKHLAAHQAARPYHYGRLRRRQVKATHVEIVVAEDPRAAKKKAKKAEAKPQEEKPVAKPSAEAPKAEAKPAVKKPAAKKAATQDKQSPQEPKGNAA